MAEEKGKFLKVASQWFLEVKDYLRTQTRSAVRRGGHFNCGHLGARLWTKTAELAAALRVWGSNLIVTERRMISTLRIAKISQNHVVSI